MSTLTVAASDPGTGQRATATASYTVQPPQPQVLFGMNYDVDGGLAAAAATLECKPFPAAKIFNSSIPASFPGHSVPASVTHPLAAIKVTLTSAAPWISATNRASLATVFASMPASGTPMVTINQEGEANRFGYSAAQVAGSHQTAYQIFRQNAPANALYCQDFQTYSASAYGRGAAFSGYVCCAANGQVDLPLYLLDWYPTSTTTNAPNSIIPAFRAIRALVPTARLGVAETNYTTSLTSGITWQGTQQQWFSDAWAWAQASGCVMFVSYFYTPHGVPWPPPTAVLTELSSIAHDTGL